NLRSHIPKSMRLHRALSKTESLMFRAQYSIALELGNYWTVAVTTKLASLSLVRLEKPKMFRVISCNLATEPPRETGWPLGTISSVCSSAQSIAPERSDAK